jgi:hypothetical protein
LIKKQQKIKSSGRLLAAQALCAANQVKPKARSFCRLWSRRATPPGKITNAFAAARPRLFYLISPEAARMTVFPMIVDPSKFKHIIQSLLFEGCWFCATVSKKASGEGS